MVGSRSASVRRGGVLGVVGLVVAALAAACAVPVADLGGPSSAIEGINDAGIAVGGSELPGSSAEAYVAHAYKRMPDNSVVDLGTLDGFPSSEAKRINDHGVVAGNATGPSGSHAVRWESDGQIVDLGVGEAWDINDAGVVVGDAGNHGFVFDPAVGHQVAMPELPGATYSVARGINDLGQVVGYQYVHGPVRAVLWDLRSGTLVDLSATLAMPFAPWDINDGGTIVGAAAFPSSTGTTSRAAILPVGWSVPIDPGAGPYSVAVGVNEANTVVISEPGARRAYRWQPTTGLVDLDPDHPSYVLDINESETMVGQSDGHAAFFGVARAP